MMRYSYTYPEAMHHLPDIAVGKALYIIGLNHYDADSASVIGVNIGIGNSDMEGIEFEVRVKEDGNWKQIRITFLSTNRADIEIGSLVYQT